MFKPLKRERCASSPIQLGFTRVGHLNLPKSDISDCVGRGLGRGVTAYRWGHNPSPGSHLAMRSDLSHMGEVRSRFARLSYLQQFANLGHADRTVAEQMACDRALRCIFREPERIARPDPVIDHHSR